jgi:hypothetical protein
MAVAAPAAVRDHCLAPERVDAPIGEGGRYGRMFDLPALDADETLLHRLGSTGGFCDGGDCEGDAQPEAGWPFFGQFIAHNLTADRSPLRAHGDLAALRNMRSPRANLESLYGGGPVGSPYLYSRDDPTRLLENGGDLPRNEEGIALIGDPRNDVHAFVSQMHVRFIEAHNLLVDRLREDGVGEGELFEEARRALCWHYQWVIVDEYLPLLAGGDLVDEVLASGPRFYRPDDVPFIPVEFADAAFRYGHSQICQLYQLQPGDVPGQPAAQRAKRMDGVLPRSLIQLPQAITGAVDEEAYRSLATRDLQRGQGTGLPSGEAVARLIGVEPLTEDELDLRRHGWEGQTPLWLYVLREAAVRHSGDRLGEVGGVIAAEVLLGVIGRDPESYLAVEPDWTPTLPARQERFRLTDILVPAG